MKPFLLFGIYMLALNLNASIPVTFPSENRLREALSPFPLEEIAERIESSKNAIPVEFQFSETLVEKKVVPLRNPGNGNLIATPLYEGKRWTVFYPEIPRVPHHLTLALNRKNVQGVADLTEAENRELFATIKKIAEIYREISLRGFVIAQYGTAQLGHQGRYVVEIIPEIAGFQGIKNIVDKVDCNRYVLFRSANLSPVLYPIAKQAWNEQVDFWKSAFQKEQTPLEKKEITLSLPHERKESHGIESDLLLQRHFLEWLENQGGQTPSDLFHDPLFMPTNVPETLKSVPVSKCFFCDASVIHKQLVYEYENVSLFYNIRKGPKPGCNFLILPKRHIEKVYGLTPSEIDQIRVVRKALVEVLKETHPEMDIVVYTQDDPSIGQTVFHTHEQVVAIDPKTVPLFWTLSCLYPTSGVSEEEMRKVKEEFGLKIQQQIEKVKEERLAS